MFEVMLMLAGDIENEVCCYIVWFGQVVFYKVGMLIIQELCQCVMDVFGDEFDWGEFYDVVLINGFVLFLFLEVNIDVYIVDILVVQ